MDFEFDPQKNKSNKIKHGIDFNEAQELWNDQNRLVIHAKSIDESRYALIAKLKRKIWTAFCTDRANSVRIISVRRARTEEVKLYES